MGGSREWSMEDCNDENPSRRLRKRGLAFINRLLLRLG